MDFFITDSHPKLIEYIDYLQHKNAEALSFYPKCVFERELINHRLLLGILNGEPCGYAYIGSPFLDLKVHQICIQYDVRNRLYGSLIVGQIENLALRHNCQTITLRCGFDLEANEFWNTLGYKCVGIQDGGVRRLRKINIWMKFLQNPLFVEVLQPAAGITDASFWRKHKQVGVINQFARGKRMKDYKTLIS
jgi:hypothetical protein